MLMPHTQHGSVHHALSTINLPRVHLGHVANVYYCILTTCGWDANMKAGIIFQRGALWIGVHYSDCEHRYCINLIPFLTLWIAAPCGRGPKKQSLITWGE